MNRFMLITTLLIAMVASLASADIIVTGTATDHDIFGDLQDVRLRVGLDVSSGNALMTFTNESQGSEESAIFKEIVLDTHDADTDTHILWNPEIVADAPFEFKNSNGLPEYGPQTREKPSLLEIFGGKSGKNKVKGLAIGESVQLSFDTALSDGSDMFDYFASFADGEDTGQYAIGFHAISADVVNGESLAGINTAIPEPATLAIVFAGGVMVLMRRKTNTNLDSQV